jgi:hypothetical protein
MKLCTNCNQYKRQPRRIKVISAGVLLLICGFIVTAFDMLRDIGHVMEAGAVALFIISIYVTGDACENCKKVYPGGSSLRKGIE